MDASQLRIAQMYRFYRLVVRCMQRANDVLVHDKRFFAHNSDVTTHACVFCKLAVDCQQNDDILTTDGSQAGSDL